MVEPRRHYGRYEALHLIASGGMASVYLGRARGAGGFERLVALKVMHAHIADDPAFSGMFLDEARLAAKIRHPNVVPTLDVADDGSYIVMEYVEGASLHAILSRRRKRGEGPLPLGVGLRIFIDALTGLHAAHELCDRRDKPLNLVHRDVSPHNILVGVDGTSRITDFGIAFAEARITSTRGGQLKGKLPYMAPEQLEDEPVDRRTDVYAAGCVLWEILTGERLFQGSNEAAIACAVLAGPDRAPSELRQDLPEELDQACMMALRRREHRFMSAIAFADAVEAASDAASVPLARHRKVVDFAKEGQTYPAPGSLISSGDVDVDAPTAREQPSTRSIDSDRAPVTAATEPPTRRVPERPVVAESADDDAPPSLQRETLVSLDGDPEQAPSQSFDESGAIETSVVSTLPGLPPKRRGSTALLIVLASAAVVAGVWFLLRDGPPAPAGVEPTASHAEPSPTPSAVVEQVPEQQALEARPSAQPKEEPPAPSASPRPTVSRTGTPATRVPVPQPAIKPLPKAPPSGYHPGTP